MKKLFLLLFTSCSLSATTSIAQLAIAPEIGISTCSMSIIPPTPYHKLSTGSITGTEIGGILDIGISKHLYFQSGLFFSVKGAAKSFGYNSGDTMVENVDQKFHIHYLELPVNVIFKINTQGQGRIFFGLGASIAYTIGGTNQLHDYGHYPNSAPFDSSANVQIQGGRDVSKLDIGLNLMAGYEFNRGLYLRAFYYYGFTDISTYGDESAKNLSYGLSVGYFVSKKRHTSLASELIAE